MVRLSVSLIPEKIILLVTCCLLLSGCVEQAPSPPWIPSGYERVEFFEDEIRFTGLFADNDEYCSQLYFNKAFDDGPKQPVPWWPVDACASGSPDGHELIIPVTAETVFSPYNLYTLESWKAEDPTKRYGPLQVFPPESLVAYPEPFEIPPTSGPLLPYPTPRKTIFPYPPPG